MQAAAALVNGFDDDGCVPGSADDAAELLAVTAAMQLPNVTFRLTPIETSRGVAPVPLAWDLERLQRRWNAEAENRLRRGAVDEPTRRPRRRRVRQRFPHPRRRQTPRPHRRRGPARLRGSRSRRVVRRRREVPEHLGVVRDASNAAGDDFKRKGVDEGGARRRRIVLTGDVPTSIAHHPRSATRGDRTCTTW